jgi:hypothetical protein
VKFFRMSAATVLTLALITPAAGAFAAVRAEDMPPPTTAEQPAQEEANDLAAAVDNVTTPGLKSEGEPAAEAADGTL